MKKCYLGVDIGGVSIKGVIIDSGEKIIASSYLYIENSLDEAVKRLVNELKKQVNLNEYKVVSVGTTGLYRKQIGTLFGASVIKNEIIAHAVGTTSIIPNVKTIFEIGGQDSKIILLEDAIVTDYAMNTLCAADIGSFLSSQAKRLGVSVEDFGNIVLSSKNPVDITVGCTVFAEPDLIYKEQTGDKKEDIIAGLCKSVVNNYLNNVGKGKKIKSPIVFQGGVSKNIGVVKAFEEATGEKVIVDSNSHLMAALGVSILAKNSKKEGNFSFNIKEVNFQTKYVNC